MYCLRYCLVEPQLIQQKMRISPVGLGVARVDLYSPPDFSLRSRKAPFKLKHFGKRGVGFGEGIIQRNRPERVLLCPGRPLLGGEGTCKRLTGINAAKGGMWQRRVGFSLDRLLAVRERLLEVLCPARGRVVVVTDLQVEACV